MSRNWMKVQVYVLPVPVTLLMAWAWRAWSGSGAFALYATLLPLLYGYIIPGIGINVLHKWRFFGPGLVGRYYLHHGFIWAANLGPALFLAMLGTPKAPLGAGTVVRVLLCAGAVHAYKGWIYDIALLRHGFAEVYNPPGLRGAAPEEITAHYVPLCFFLIGLTYALGALVAYHYFVVLGRTDAWAQGAAWTAGALAMGIVPSVAYGLVEHRDPGVQNTQRALAKRDSSR